MSLIFRPQICVDAHIFWPLLRYTSEITANWRHLPAKRKNCVWGGAESVPTNTALLHTCQICKVVFSGEINKHFFIIKGTIKQILIIYCCISCTLVNVERNVDVIFLIIEVTQKKSLKSSALIGLYKQ
jgi:hypothetical protein